jgi:hypothetical protein
LDCTLAAVAAVHAVSQSDDAALQLHAHAKCGVRRVLRRYLLMHVYLCYFLMHIANSASRNVYWVSLLTEIFVYGNFLTE